MVSRAWRLWIDESGAFDDPDRDVVVAGVLVRADVASFADRALRSALARAAPDCPWPLHAAPTHSLCMYALWPAHRAGAEGATDSVTREAIALLSHYAAPTFAKAMGALNAGREPHYDLRRELDRWLVHGPLAPALEARRADVRLAIRGVVEQAAARAGPDRAWCVVAAESIPGDAWGRPLTDRYLNLLACLLQRARDLLFELGGHHVVNVLASQRHVHTSPAGGIFGLSPRTPQGACGVAPRSR